MQGAVKHHNISYRCILPDNEIIAQKGSGGNCPPPIGPCRRARAICVGTAGGHGRPCPPAPRGCPRDQPAPPAPGRARTPSPIRPHRRARPDQPQVTYINGARPFGIPCLRHNASYDILAGGHICSARQPLVGKGVGDALDKYLGNPDRCLWSLVYRKLQGERAGNAAALALPVKYIECAKAEDSASLRFREMDYGAE